VESLLTDLPSESMFIINKEIKNISPLNFPFTVFNSDKDIMGCFFTDYDNPVAEGTRRSIYPGTRFITKGKPYISFDAPSINNRETMFYVFNLYGYEKSFVFCRVFKKQFLKIWTVDERLKETGDVTLKLASPAIQNQNQDD
jgi:hypothetical protein